MSKLKNAITKLDGWVNSITGQGITTYDPLLSSRHHQGDRLSDSELQSLYVDNDIAARIVDQVVDDAFREGCKILVNGEDVTAELEEKWKITEKVMQADKWSRLYGGAALWFGYNDQELEALPVDPASEIEFMRPLTRVELNALTWEHNPANDRFGLPQSYMMTVQFSGSPRDQQPIIHHEISADRLEVFRGVVTTRDRMIALRGWGDSVLQRVLESLRSFDSSWSSAMALLKDASVGIYKIKDLFQLLTSDNADAMITRLRQIDQSKSTRRSIVLDSESEDYSRVATPMAELANLLDRAMGRIASSAQMPVTLLFGKSPAGLNATGENDTRMWYDRVAAHQSNHLAPHIESVVRRIYASVGADVEVEAVFPPLWSPTAAESVSLYGQLASADTTYIGAGVYSPQQVAEFRADPANALEPLSIAAPVAAQVPADSQSLEDDVSTNFRFSDKPTPEGDDAVTARALAQELGIPTRTITRAAEKGEIRAWNVLGKVIFSRDEVIDLLREQNAG